MSEENPLSKMIDHITAAEFEKANAIFNDELGARISDELDQAKIAMAGAMYKDMDPEEMEDEFSDEELENAAEENFDDEDLED